MVSKKKILLDWWWINQSASGFQEPTAPDSDIILKFNLYELSSMFQERSVFAGGVPTTAVTANTNPVGTIFDQSLATTFLRATAAGAIPTLTADGITFDGSSDRLEVPTSTVYLKGLHAPNAVWSMRFWVKKGLDGAARPMICNQGLSGGHFGIYIQATAANKVRIHFADGANPPIADYTSTADLTVAMGATPIQIIINGAASKLIIGSTEETFTSTWGGSTSNATTNLFIGSDGTTFFNGSFSRDIVFINRVWTAQEISDYQSYNPAVTSNDFTPIKQWDLDFNDTAYVFSDAGETTPVTDGAVIRSVKNKVLIPYSTAISRKLTAASDAVAPVWRQAVLNGLSVGEWDPSDNVMNYSEDLWLEVGGTSTVFFVVKNDDNVFGSHYVNGAPEYGTITGKDYSGNLASTGDAAQPYTVLHNGLTAAPQILTSRSDGYNIICIRRKGINCDGFNQVKTKTSTASFGKFTSTLIGTASVGPDWNMDGKIARIEKYMGYLTDAQVEAKIDLLKTTYGIPGTLA